MKAAVYTEYGSPGVLQLKDLARPEPKPNELLLRIKATTVNSGDVKLRKADPFAIRLFFGLMKPRVQVLGSVFSGEVVAVGDKVRRFKAGDQVFGHTDMKFGAHAEYLCVAEGSSLALKPSILSHAEAAALPFGGVAALHFLRKASIQPGQKVLVVGASGAVGSAAVQLAAAYGAVVTGVCSTANLSLVKSLGAAHVIDYTKNDFTKTGEVYNVVIDTVNRVPVRRLLRSVADKGTVILSAAGLTQMIQGLGVAIFTRRKVLQGLIRHDAKDILFLKELVVTGKYRPVIDRTYHLSQIEQAHAYVEKGHKKGNVPIQVTD